MIEKRIDKFFGVETQQKCNRVSNISVLDLTWLIFPCALKLQISQEKDRCHHSPDLSNHTLAEL